MVPITSCAYHVGNIGLHIWTISRGSYLIGSRPVECGHRLELPDLLKVNLKRILLAVFLIAAAGIIVFASVLMAPPFDRMRSDWISERLGEATGKKVDVASMSVSLGRDMRIDIRGVHIEDGDQERLSVGEAAFSVAYPILWGAPTALHDFRFQGVNWTLVASRSERASETDTTPSHWPTDVLAAIDFRKISIRDSQLSFRVRNGRSLALSIHDLTAQQGDGDSGISVAVEGLMDELPFDLTGIFDDPNAPADADGFAFDVSVTHPGLSGSIAGKLDQTRELPNLMAEFSAETTAPDWVLGLLGIEGDIEASGRVSGRLEGPLTAPEVKHMKVSLRDLDLTETDNGTGLDRLSIGLAEFELASDGSQGSGYLARDIVLTRVNMALRPATESDETPKEAGRKRREFGLASISEHVDLGTVLVRDSIFRMQRKTGGWEHELWIDTLTGQRAGASKQLVMEAKGTINQQPFSARTLLDDPQKVSDRSAIRFEASSDLAGLPSTLFGTLDLAAQEPGIDAKFGAQATSVGALLKTIGFAPRWDGAAKLSGQLKGPLRNPSLNSIDMELANDDEFFLSIGGRIGQILNGSDIDLTFKGNVGSARKQRPDNAGLMDVKVREFRGRVTGSAKELALEQLRMVTNIVSADLKEIGPVEIGRIIHGDDGKLRLEGIRIRDGPEDAPYLDLAGDIGDALDFKEVKFQGNVNVGAADILQPQAGLTTGDLGRFQAVIAFSDEGGILELDELEARVVDTDVIDLRATLADNNGTADGGKIFKTDLSIRDLSRLAAALGQTLRHRTAVRFVGTFGLANKDPKFDGTITIGASVLKTELTADHSTGNQKIVGTVQSEMLGLEDLNRSADALRLFGSSDLAVSRDQIDLEPSGEFTNRLAADISIKVNKIAGAGKAASRINGRIVYRDDVLMLDPFEMVFLGGKSRNSIRVDLGGNTVVHRHRGQIEGLPLGRLLQSMGKVPTVTGTIRARYEVTTRGLDIASAMANLNGSGTFSLWDSTIDGKLIDLAGTNAVSWLFSGKSKNRKITCIVVPIQFENGRGLTEALIVETGQVQLAGKGVIDLRREAIDIAFEPSELGSGTVNVPTDFRVVGSLVNPQVKLGRGGGAGRAATEVVTAPLNILGILVDKAKSAKSDTSGRAACTPVETPAPQGVGEKRPDRNKPAKTRRKKKGPIRKLLPF